MLALPCFSAAVLTSMQSFQRACGADRQCHWYRAGIPEDDLVGELAALNPMSAKQLLEILLKQGLLLVQTIKIAPTCGPPAFFGAKQSVGSRVSNFVHLY